MQLLVKIITKNLLTKHEILDENNNKINTLHKKIKYNNLTYYFKTKRNTIDFNDFNRLLCLKRKA